MANEEGWFDRYVDSLPERGWFKFLSKNVVLPYWAIKNPAPKLPGGPRETQQNSENVRKRAENDEPCHAAKRQFIDWASQGCIGHCAER